MPKKPKTQLYCYKGKDTHGKIVKGEIHETHSVAVKAYLRSNNIIPIRVRKKFQFFWKNTISSWDITLFTRQLSTMLVAGIPLVQSFDMVAKGHSNPRMAQLIERIKILVESGKSFTQALANYPQYFSELYIHLVEAGERAGALDTMLQRLATYREKTQAIKGKIQKALFYPAIIFLVAIFVTLAILFFVIPQFQELFKNFGADLPLLTLMIIHLAQFIQNRGWLFLIFILLFFSVLFYVLKKYPLVTKKLDLFSLKIIIIGPMIKKAAVARFSRTLATSFAAGVPLVDALKTVSGTTGNWVFNQASLEISLAISRGLQLQQAIKNTAVFPELLIQMVAIGEASGELESMLNKVAEFYEEEVDNAVDTLSTLVEPLIMLILGTLLGILIIAMYLPLFKLGSVI